MEDDARPRRHRWLVISLAVLAAASLAGCGAVTGTVTHPDAPTASMVAGPVVVGSGEPVSPDHASPSPSASRSPASARASAHSSDTAGQPQSNGQLPPQATSQASSGPPTNQGAGGECVTSVARGSCGPYDASSVAIAAGTATINNDVWNPVTSWSQTLHATSLDNWYVTANMPAGNVEVMSYPSEGDDYSGNTLLSNFSSIYSSFSEDMHAISATSAWATYDIWLNNWGNEVMIQNDFANNGACAVLATVKFGGSGGVPVQKWNLCKYGTDIIWKLTGGNEQSGAVDILAMLNWLVSSRYLPEGSNLTDIGYGWEVASTGGKPETFTMSRFTVTAS